MDMSLPDDSYELNQPVAYELHVSDELLRTTKEKLKISRFPVELDDVGEDDWSQGAKVSEVRRLSEYWLHKYDWRAQEASINASYKQFKVKIDTGTRHGTHVIHFAHHPSADSNAIPLLFVAGWPGSFLEAGKLIQPLTSPPAGSNFQAFHFVVGSVPGFGPGDPPTKTGFGPATIAKAFKQLMVDVLNYRKFVTQGGDFGASVTRLMALQFPQHVAAYHLNFVPVRPPSLLGSPLAASRFLLRSYLYTAREQENIASIIRWQTEESAYSNIQRTKPQSLGFGLCDSPVGLLGWFLEKFHGWTDTENYKHPDDEIINNVMMHWIQGATPGLRSYKSSVQENAWQKEAGEQWMRETAWTSYSAVPLGYSSFPKEISRPPLDWVRAAAKLDYYREHNRGGHFAAVEQPDLLVHDLREWFGSELVRSILQQ